MGFDISYHPISEEQINTWYFEVITNPEKIESLASEHQIDDFYKTKYQDTINAGRETDQNDYFDKTHGFFIAVVQGFFETYFYVRGGGLSFSENTLLDSYYKKWEEFIPKELLTKKVENRLIENYCSGVYISADQVVRLLDDYHHNLEIKSELDQLFSDGRISIFLKALNFAKERGLGLLEATEVVEPQPLDLNESKSYSNLFNCDKEGPLLYQAVAFEQIKDIEQRNGLPENEILHNVKVETVHVEPTNTTAGTEKTNAPAQKKGFWKRLFG
ncbi:hypothetical protein BWD42_10330 [Sphingobacterium sp. CZ-UAM]|uniref:hypothetical protein n=1 Tax=Sphingobacterium sp. CZ-UAM TaxID=1933868 RepID=UPI00098744EF|nr:hypothetical protein [Sphingobacterium sp. CZ-UAM]OOG17710.1 hypothetical protein BWD42_10330 [Sphingobacterium sp. CZ-UAM]